MSKIYRNLSPVFLFLIFCANNASFDVVFSLNELNDYHVVLISCYLNVLFKNSVQSSDLSGADRTQFLK